MTLPRGWAEVPIGDVCRVVGGSTPSTKTSEYWDGEVPWLTPDDLARDRSQYVSVGRRTISQAGYDSCSTQMLPTGSVLFTSRAPIGYVAIARQPVCTNQGFKSFVPPDVLSSEYLYWHLIWATPLIRKMGSGTTFSEISGKVARTIPIRIAPQGEQFRIVAAIEEQFSRLDEAERLLRSARHRAERLRTAAMAAAMSGDWPVKALADVTAKQEYGSSAKASATDTNGVPMVRMGNIQDGRVDLSRDVKYLPINHPEAERYGLQDGDLLFNRSNSPELVGKSAVFRGSPGFACFASYLIRVQLDDRCLPEWASLYLNSPKGRRWAASVRSQQVGQANINGSKLAAMALPLPPVDEQHRILGEVDRQVSLVDSAISVVDRALVRSGRLRRAVLSRAFSGRLVPQDPADEPASKLLARLGTDSSVNPNGARRRKRS